MEMKQFTMMSNMKSMNSMNEPMGGYSSSAYMDPMTGMMVDPMMTGMNTMTGSNMMIDPMTGMMMNNNMTGSNMMIDPMTGMMINNTMNNNMMNNSMMDNGMMMNNNSMIDPMTGMTMMNNGMMTGPDENGMIPGMVPGYVPDMYGNMVQGMVPGMVPAPPEMMKNNQQPDNGQDNNMNDQQVRASREGLAARISGEGLAARLSREGTRQSGEGIEGGGGEKVPKTIASLEDTMKAFEKNLNDQGLQPKPKVQEQQQKQLLRKPSNASSANPTTKKNSSFNASAKKSIYHIPRYAVMLEDKPFAHGGGGQIFKGMYMGNAIAAKQVYDSKSGQAHSEDFDNEVAVLTKLSHPCILSCFGVTADEDGSMYQV